MSWRDHRAEASFRGVPFTIDEHSAQGGRRAVLAEVPGSDRPPSSEDFGPSPREWTIRGHVVGADYEGQRDALIAALETEGPGELIHPYHGTRTVVVSEYRVTQSTRTGGLAEFEITAHEVAETITPSATVDTAAALEESAESAKATVVATFLAAYEALPSGSEALAASIRGVSGRVSDVAGASPLTGPALAEVRHLAARVLARADALVLDPDTLVEEIEALVSALENGIREAGVTQVAARLLGLYDADLGDRPTGGTPTRDREQADYDAIQQVYQGTVIAHAAAAAVDDEWEAYEDAVAVRDQVLEILDTHLDQAVDDDYEALTDLRTKLISAVPPEDQGLPHLRTVELPTTLPSIVAAQYVYGDSARAAEIEARNGIEDPLMPGTRRLEVLT